ncbi:hypothetical protein Gpo141_00002765 [Globisporangium polare]
MNAWNVDEDSGSSGLSAIQPSKRDSTGASFQVKKHAFFAEDDDDSTSFQSREPPSSRRKQSLTGHKELVIDDDDDDLDERKRVERQPQLQQPGHRSEQGNLATRTVKASSSAGETEAQHHPSKSSLKSAKVDETGVPEVIHTVLRTRVSQSSGSSSATSSSTNTPSTSSSSSKKRVSLTDLSPVTTELLMHYLVHEFLKLHIADDGVVSLFEKEQQPTHAALDENEAKKLFEHITGKRDASSRNKSAGASITSSPDEKPWSLLEQFLVAWNEATHQRKCERPSSSTSSSRRSSGGSSSSRQSEVKLESSTGAGAKKKIEEKSSSSARKKKPTLNVITASEDLDNVDAMNNDGRGDGDDDTGVDYNRLNHPGSTPKPQGAASILGDPGSTPKARASDLKALGFDEEELNTPVPIENATSIDPETDAADLSSLSEYAKKKRIAKKHSKHVFIGESGSTPTKEYIFFRETPPSFVTETVEDAIDVLEKLGLDPAFHQQAPAPQEKFVELQSSEVSKYKIGQEVQNLGAQRNVSGVVSKIFGSRQCGSSGPGTIVIDTCPDGDLGAVSRTATAPAVSALNNDDEALITELP